MLVRGALEALMAKPKTSPIIKSDMEDYLKSSSDFAFELSVLRALKAQGLACEHGGHYVDSVTKKSREFDIRARVAFGHYRLRLAIECKNIREYCPILVSCMPRDACESYHEAMIIDEKANSGVWPNATALTPRGQSFRYSRRSVLYLAGEPVGKSTAQVLRLAHDDSFSSSDSEIYEKWGQALASADDLVQESYWDDSSDPLFAVVLPVLVVPNGMLWRAVFDESGNISNGPEQVERCSVFVGKSYYAGSSVSSIPYTISHVDFVTVRGLNGLVEEYARAPDGLVKLMN